jgi:hypothetical protein
MWRIRSCDPEWTLPSCMDANPAEWTLQARDRRFMRLIESEALGETLQQTLVCDLCMFNHRRIGFEQDVEAVTGFIWNG